MENNDLITTVFSSLKHPTRRGIIEELGGADSSLTFSELMRRVGIDDSGTFGFHLRALESIVDQDKEAKYHLTKLGNLAFEIVSMAESSDIKDEVRGTLPVSIFEVMVEGNQSQEPVGLSVRSKIGDKDHRKKVIGFMMKRLKEMEDAELELICEIQLFSSSDGKSSRVSQNWKVEAGGDRKKWRELIISKLQDDIGEKKKG